MSEPPDEHIEPTNASLLAVVHGTGSIGRRHPGVLREAGFQRVVAVPVRGGDGRADLMGFEVASQVPIGADLVVDATDTARHVDDAPAALAAGARAVLIEKPVAPTVADAQPLPRHPEAHRVRVSAPLRFQAGLAQAHSPVEGLTNPLRVRIVSQSWLPGGRPHRPFCESYSARPDEGGVLRDVVHELDYAIQLFGEPDVVQVAISTLPSPVHGLNVDEAADVLWHRRDGSAVSLSSDFVTQPARRALIVRSAVGEVRWDAGHAPVQSFAAEGQLLAEVDCAADLDPNEALRDQSSAPCALLSGQTSEVPATLVDGVRVLGVGERIRDLAPDGEGA